MFLQARVVFLDLPILISLHCLHLDLNFHPMPWLLSLHEGHNVSFIDFSPVL